MAVQATNLVLEFSAVHKIESENPTKYSTCNNPKITPSWIHCLFSLFYNQIQLIYGFRLLKCNGIAICEGISVEKLRKLNHMNSTRRKYDAKPPRTAEFEYTSTASEWHLGLGVYCRMYWFPNWFRLFIWVGPFGYYSPHVLVLGLSLGPLGHMGETHYYYCNKS